MRFLVLSRGILFLTYGFRFCREVFCFCREVFGFDVTVVGYRTKGFFLTENEVFRNFSFDGEFSIYLQLAALKSKKEKSARTSWLNAIYTTSPQCLASTCSS